MSHFVRALCASFTLALFAVPGIAQADVVVQNFRGTVSNPPFPPSDLFAAGETFTGTIKYNPNGTPADMHPYCGADTCPGIQYYTDVPYEISITFGSNTWFASSSTGATLSYVDARVNNNKADVMFWYGLTGPSIGTPSMLSPATPDYLYFLYTEERGNLLFPPNGFVSPNFGMIQMFFDDGTGILATRALYVDEFYPAVLVPTPESLPLVGIALAALYLSRRRVHKGA